MRLGLFGDSIYLLINARLYFAWGGSSAALFGSRGPSLTLFPPGHIIYVPNNLFNVLDLAAHGTALLEYAALVQTKAECCGSMPMYDDPIAI